MRSVSPFIFTLFILLSTFTLLNIFFILVADYKINNIPKTVSLIEKKIQDTKNQIEVTKNQIAQNKEILETKNILFKMAGNVLSNEEIVDCATIIVEESARYNIDKKLIISLIATESSFRTSVVSNKGAVGLMQILPPTAKYISKKNNITSYSSHTDLHNPKINLKLGIAYFDYLIEKTGSIDNAIIAYNYGPGNLKRAINNGKALPQKYHKSVKRNYNRVTKLN